MQVRWTLVNPGNNSQLLLGLMHQLTRLAELLLLIALAADLVDIAAAGLRMNPCGGQPDGAIFPNQQKDKIVDCTNYVVCKGGKDVFIACPACTGTSCAGSNVLHFNPDAMKCEEPDKAGCKVGARSPKPVLCKAMATFGRRRSLQALTTNPCTGQRYGAIFPNQKRHIIVDCSKYVVCKNGADTFIPCPPCLEGDTRCGGAKTLVFNPHKLQCDYPAGAGCKVGMTTTKPLNCGA